MKSEILRIIERAQREARIREESSPRECFAPDHDYVEMMCDDWMAEEYYRKAKHRVCLECRYWHDCGGCIRPFGLRHLMSIIKNFLWRLRWRFPPLDWMYRYHFRLRLRRGR